MKKTLLILFIFIAAGLSCHSPQRILLAERDKTKNTFSILIDTNRLKSLIAEDSEINNANHNLLVTPSQTLIIENNNMDTGMDAFVSFLRKNTRQMKNSLVIQLPKNMALIRLFITNIFW